MPQAPTYEWNHFKPEQEYCICSTYRKDRTLCKTHSIRRVVLEEIALRNLRERDKALAQKKAVLAQSEKRIAELDVCARKSPCAYSGMTSKRTG